MTANEAMSKFANRYRDLTIVRCIDYDASLFVVCAVHDPNGPKEMDPFYAIDKSTGSIAGFSPSSDVPKFAKAMRTRTVYKYGER